MSAFRDLVIVDEFRIRLLGPALRGWIEFVWEDAHRSRDSNAFGAEKPNLAPIFPIQAGGRKGRVRQPRDRDVVEDVVAREAFGRSLNKDTRDQLVTARVVVEEIRGQTDG